MNLDFDWKPPANDKWSLNLAEIKEELHNSTDINSASKKLKQLANYRLDPIQSLKITKLIEPYIRQEENFGCLLKVNLAIASTHTLSLLPDSLKRSGLGRGMLIQAIEAPYDSMMPLALGHIKPFEKQKLDAIVLYFDQDSFVKQVDLNSTAQTDELKESIIEKLITISEKLKAAYSCPVIINTMPNKPSSVLTSIDKALYGTQANLTQIYNDIIFQGGQEGRWIIWDAAQIAAYIGEKNWHSPTHFFQSKIAISPSATNIAADHLSKVVAALKGKTARVLILDLDNTLWGGVIGDDGLDGIQLGQGSAQGEAFLEFQKYILNLKRRGVVLAVCSKNTDSIARKPFQNHPEMLLKESDIAVFQANWQDKASNIVAIAETLNLGLESCVFVDDNPAERSLVRDSLPLVSVPEMPTDPARYSQILNEAGYFEHFLLNEDDLKRADTYRSNAIRVEIRNKAANYEEYLQSLNMVVEIQPFQAVDLKRIVQLINKTNQFNLMTVRHSEEDIKKIVSDSNHFTWQVRLSDNFGSQGLISTVIARQQNDSWIIDTWLMSCRALERKVEHVVMNQIVNDAKELGVSEIIGEYLPTERNVIVKDLYTSFGFEKLSEDNKKVAFKLNLQDYRELITYSQVERAI